MSAKRWRPPWLRGEQRISESDPLRLEADYDALSQGLEPDYTEWLASVAAIKQRFPLPAAAEPLSD